MFEAIGFHVAQVRDASPLRAFRFRFPWLLATIGSGTICAVLAGAFEMTLAKSLVLAFFLTLVLGLGESVSIQSMTVAIQALRATRPTLRWYLRALRREAGTALLFWDGSVAVVTRRGQEPDRASRQGCSCGAGHDPDPAGWSAPATQEFMPDSIARASILVLTPRQVVASG